MKYRGKGLVALLAGVALSTPVVVANAATSTEAGGFKGMGVVTSK